MKSLFIYAVVGLPLGAIFFRTTDNHAHRAPVTTQLSQNMPAPPPGIYQSSPYSVLVMVPRPVDTHLVHMPGTDKPCVIRSVHPRLQLVPKQ